MYFNNTSLINHFIYSINIFFCKFIINFYTPNINKSLSTHITNKIISAIQTQKANFGGQHTKPLGQKLEFYSNIGYLPVEVSWRPLY